MKWLVELHVPLGNCEGQTVTSALSPLRGSLFPDSWGQVPRTLMWPFVPKPPRPLFWKCPCGHNGLPTGTGLAALPVRPCFCGPRQERAEGVGGQLDAGGYSRRVLVCSRHHGPKHQQRHFFGRTFFFPNQTSCMI